MSNELVKRIVYGDGRSLEDLDINPGDFVAFDNSSNEVLTPPFLITQAKEKLMAGKLPNPCGVAEDLYLIFSNNSEVKKYLLTNRGTIGLYSPDLEIVRMPNISLEPITTYVAESAFVGEEEIIKALAERQKIGLDFYIPWLKQEFERLRTSK
ncbi:MAG: hypothetical protein AABW51_00310 [Nanoarchaeota archaeon]